MVFSGGNIAREEFTCALSGGLLELVSFISEESHNEKSTCELGDQKLSEKFHECLFVKGINSA